MQRYATNVDQALISAINAEIFFFFQAKNEL